MKVARVPTLPGPSGLLAWRGVAPLLEPTKGREEQLVWQGDP